MDEKVELAAGWGLTMAPWLEEFMVREEVPGTFAGCTNRQCNHVSHDPASSSFSLTPKPGFELYVNPVSERRGAHSYRYHYRIVEISSGDEVAGFIIDNEENYWPAAY